MFAVLAAIRRNIIETLHGMTSQGFLSTNVWYIHLDTKHTREYHGKNGENQFKKQN